MTKRGAYRYFKRSEWKDTEAWMIFRERRDNPFELEQWVEDRWVNAFDLWWDTRDNCFDYWDMTRKEAMEQLPKLTERQRRLREERNQQEAAARQKILDDRAAEQARRNERRERNDWTALETAAITMHEIFTALCEAGFTEEQALTLVAKTLRGTQESDDAAV